MKRYKLLKDLPFAQAGDIFKMMDDDGREVLVPEEWLGYRHKIVIEKLENLDDWFEETKELKKYWFVDGFGGINIGIVGEYLNTERKLKQIGNYFEAEEDAEKHLKWLKARAVLLEDTKLKTVIGEDEYSAAYDQDGDEMFPYNTYCDRCSEIVFSSLEDAKNSMESHEQEWKVYLGVE